MIDRGDDPVAGMANGLELSALFWALVLAIVILGRLL